MTNQSVLDPATLLDPFAGDNAAGQDPRADATPSSPFLRMKDSRTDARRKERALDVDDDAPLPTEDWENVAEAGCMILSEVGKDLEVCAWLIEALLRIDGIAGLCAGLEVARGLIEVFWDAIYPLPDEDGLDARLSPFVSLNGGESDGTLIQALRKTSLTTGPAGYAFWQYKQALVTETFTDSAKRQARISEGALSMEQFVAAVRETPGAFYVDLLEDVAAARQGLDAVSQAFAAKVGRDAPPAGALRGILQDIEDAVRGFAADKLALAAASSAAAESTIAEVSGTDATADEATGAVQGSPAPAKAVSREDAFRQLLKIASYFRETEPHSPISYSLEEIVRRGRLPLPQLLEELIMDADARRFFFIASGVRPKEESE